MKTCSRGIVYLLFMICFTFVGLSFPQDNTMLPIMPVPASVQSGSGWFPIDGSLRVSIKGEGDSRVTHAVIRFFANLSSRTGIRCS